MDWITIGVFVVITMLLIAFVVILRLVAEEITEDIYEFKRRNRWRKRYRHHRKRK